MILSIGDRVLWRGAFGLEGPRLARVTRIELVDLGQKDGRAVDAVPWSAASGRQIVVDLDNGHWAYGDQLAPEAPDTSDESR